MRSSWRPLGFSSGGRSSRLTASCAPGCRRVVLSVYSLRSVPSEGQVVMTVRHLGVSQGISPTSLARSGRAHRSGNLLIGMLSAVALVAQGPPIGAFSNVLVLDCCAVHAVGAAVVSRIRLLDRRVVRAPIGPRHYSVPYQIFHVKPPCVPRSSGLQGSTCPIRSPCRPSLWRHKQQDRPLLGPVLLFGVWLAGSGSSPLTPGISGDRTGGGGRRGSGTPR